VTVVKGVAKSGVSSNRTKAVSSTVLGVTEPDATGPSPVSLGPHDAPPHTEQVVRRVLLRRNIVIDAETAQLLAAAVQAALQAVRLPGRRAGARVFARPIASRCSDKGSCREGLGDKTPGVRLSRRDLNGQDSRLGIGAGKGARGQPPGYGNPP
jgi:hypothetical protein